MRLVARSGWKSIDWLQDFAVPAMAEGFPADTKKPPPTNVDGGFF
jgi:hypothetical protein